MQESANEGQTITEVVAPWALVLVLLIASIGAIGVDRYSRRRSSRRPGGR